MAANIDSPFKDYVSPHDTTNQNGIQDGGMGAVPGPASNASPYNVQSFGGFGTNAINFESPYRDAVVDTVPVVKSADEGGTAPMESPFADAIAKEKK